MKVKVNVVTSGASRPMKDSGVEWLGQIPEKWSVVRTKHCYAHCKEIVGNKAAEYERLALTLNGVIKRSKDDTEGLQPESFSGYQILRPKELVFKLIDLENVSTSRVGRSPFEGLVSPAYIVLKPRLVEESKYGELYYLSMWQRHIFNQLGDDGVRSSLNASDLLNIPYLLVPPDEKTEIIQYLNSKCAHIDDVIEKTRESIEEYKKLKQSIITEAVTKGIRPNRKLKNSGIDWIGSIPCDWIVYRVCALYSERNEHGKEDLPILTVSINSGISDHEVSENEQIRQFVRSDDRTKYKRVYKGDLAYNMMRAWQGAFGAVRVDGMVSPAYVVARPKLEGVIDSRYIESLLRTPSAIEEMHRYSRGIADFRLRLYWPEFKNLKVCLPSYEEQVEIADYIDHVTNKADSLIDKKETLLMSLSELKTSIIYEYVTGKR